MNCPMCQRGQFCCCALTESIAESERSIAEADAFMADLERFRGDVPSTSSPGAPSMAVNEQTSPPAAKPTNPKGT